MSMLSKEPLKTMYFNLHLLIMARGFVFVDCVTSETIAASFAVDFGM